MKIKKVLVANRGEIALRVIRACRELGIKTVCVYSDADKQSLHVKFADTAIPIGGTLPGESYLVKDKILDAAKKSGADAIHPGYGFLAENSDFVLRCENENIKFIGPSSRSVKRMGDKTQARNLVRSVDVPTVTGIWHTLSGVLEAKKAAKQIGYPVLLKAALGGGGRGMRKVLKDEEMEDAFLAARREAQLAFADPSMYMEKYVERPRHIEVQILADERGNVIHLGERECSIQRKNQKLIEESPSPVVTEKEREKLGGYAVTIAKASGYENAGTIEFIRSPEGEYFFLEMNTRIQVEHPVTEEVSGVDLVKAQLLIAMGEKLERTQDDIKISGHAFECRINAEDPFNNFISSPGKISYLNLPLGPGIRVDTFMYPGFDVPAVYDSLLAKLIVKGANRNNAMTRMQNALDEFKIHGIKTTLPFHKRIFQNKAFIEGRLHTHFIEEQSDALSFEGISDEEIVAIAAGILKASQTQISQTQSNATAASAWKTRARSDHLRSPARLRF